MERLSDFVDRLPSPFPPLSSWEGMRILTDTLAHYHQDVREQRLKAHLPPDMLIESDLHGMILKLAPSLRPDAWQHQRPPELAQFSLKEQEYLQDVFSWLLDWAKRWRPAQAEALRQFAQSCSLTWQEHTKAHQVLVFHGKLARLNIQVFAFLRMLGLAPLSWTEVIQTLPPAKQRNHALLDQSQASMVLLTPSDIQEDTTSHSVAAEAGLVLMGYPESCSRTMLIGLGMFPPPSLLPRLPRMQLTNHTESRWQLFQFLQQAGCPATIPNNQFFREIGDFRISTWGDDSQLV